MRRLMIVNALLLAAAVAVAGCGGKQANRDGIASVTGNGGHASATPSPTPSMDRQAQALAFARCMRAHGVNMPDPQINGNGIRIQVPGGSSQQAMEAAQNACKHFLPNGGTPPSLSPEQVDQMRKYAACMRQHGVDMADPGADGRIQIRSGAGPNDPKFQAAEEACKSLTPKGIAG